MSEPATDDFAKLRSRVAEGWGRYTVERDELVELLARLDAERARAEAAERRMDGWIKEHDERMNQCEQLEEKLSEPLHASAPPGHKCADCTIDKEPCPDCYWSWWESRHPNTHFMPGRADGRAALHAIEAGLRKEFGQQSMEGHDVVSAMEAFLEHHKSVETSRDELRAALRSVMDTPENCRCNCGRCQAARRLLEKQG